MLGIPPCVQRPAGTTTGAVPANVALCVANLLPAGEFPITSFLALKGDMFSQP